MPIGFLFSLLPSLLLILPLALQILDFGLARQADAEMTGYVVTRWYRAPEVILNWMHYNQTGEQPCPACHSLVMSWGILLAQISLNCPVVFPPFHHQCSLEQSRSPEVLHNSQSCCLQEIMKAEILAA